MYVNEYFDHSSALKKIRCSSNKITQFYDDSWIGQQQQNPGAKRIYQVNILSYLTPSLAVNTEQEPFFIKIKLKNQIRG